MCPGFTSRTGRSLEAPPGWVFTCDDGLGGQTHVSAEGWQSQQPSITPTTHAISIAVLVISPARARRTSRNEGPTHPRRLPGRPRGRRALAARGQEPKREPNLAALLAPKVSGSVIATDTFTLNNRLNFSAADGNKPNQFACPLTPIQHDDSVRSVPTLLFDLSPTSLSDGRQPNQ
jgi:hypothetical protein